MPVGELEPTGLYVPGHGEPRTLVVPNPAVATGLTFTVPGAEVWRPVSLVFTLATDANAANRNVLIEYRDQTGTAFCVSGPGVAVTANLTRRLAGAAHRAATDQATGTDVFFPLEPAVLMFGESVVLTIGAIQAGDQVSSVRLRVEQWPVSG